MVKFLRWLLVPVSAVAVLVLGAAVGRWFVTQADSRCDSANMIGGACVESWQTGLIENTIYVLKGMDPGAFYPKTDNFRKFGSQLYNI